MFDRFGEFDSAAEINATAEGLLKEGDTESLYLLAQENGIDKEDVEDYLNGDTGVFATPIMAALGKLEVENRELKMDRVMKDWKDAVIDLCIEDALICAAVRKKGKSLTDCMAGIIKFSFENKVQVSEKIVKATKVLHNGKLEPLRGPLYLGEPDRAQTKTLIRDYYMK